MTIHINEYPPFWADVLGVDLETTGHPYPPEEKAGLDPFKGHILSVALSDGQDVWLFLHWFGLDKLKSVLEDENIVHVFHNAAFDMAWLKLHLDIEVQNIFDTQLAEQVLIAAREMHATLADALSRRIGVMIYKETRESFFSHPGYHIQPITDEQIEYSANDVIYLPALRDAQLIEAEKDKCVWTVQLENEAVPAFVEIRLGGFKLDVDRWYKYTETFKSEIEKSETKLREMLGIDYELRFMNKSKIKPVEKVYKVDEINFGSPEQLRHVLQGFDPKIDNTDRKYLEELSDDLEDDSPLRLFIEEFLNCKHWEKCLSWNFPKHIHPVTGRVQPEVHQIGTDTGRTSFTKPGMQQIPKPVPDQPDMRLLWSADSEDLVLAGADWSQQEIRILADLSKDKELITACNKKDVYLEVGAAMYGKEIKKTDPERQIAKMFALATGYRSGIGRLRRQSGLPSNRCKEIRQIIWDKYPTMRKYGQLCEGFVKRNNYIMTISGRRRYFSAKNRIYTESVNAPVQGSAADMAKIAIAMIYKKLVEWKKQGLIDKRSRIWHLMHDEILVQCGINDSEKVCKMITECMENAGTKLCPSVLHIAEAHSGYRWSK